MNKDHQTIALICCRGGSKGIPKKNIKLFAEKPLLGWTLETAKESKVFDDIILSTDSEEIANVGRDYGATVPGLRPEHLARDDSDQFDTHSHIFSQLSITDKTHRVCILVNNPLINVRLIKESYSKAFSQKFHKIVVDCVPVEDDFVFYRQCYESGNGELRFQFPFAMLNSGINRQTIAPTYTSMNNLRWAKPSILSSYQVYKNEIVNNGFIPVWLPLLRNFELHDEETWRLAEIVFKELLSDDRYLNREKL